MILTKEIKILLNQFNYHHYERIGYDTIGKEFIMVNIKDIGERTSIRIDVKCDICFNEKTISYRKYSDNISKYKIYSCSNKCAMFKNRITNLEKYGNEHQCRVDFVKDKILLTKLERGIISDSFDNFIDYRRVVNNLTNRVKNKLYNNWSGLDYYDNEYIKDNINLNFNDINYPTIDHKISVFDGFKNKITPEEISDINNLCITKRCNNSSKGYKSEEVYKKKYQD